MSHLTGQVHALSISAAKGTPKNNVLTARLRVNWGLEGDAHAGSWHRQVSLLPIESIEDMQAKGLPVQPGDFAENITTACIDTSRLCVGDQIQIGEGLLEVTQIGKVCHGKCVIYKKIGACIMPQEGVFTRVVSGGLVRVGDCITIRSGGIPSPEQVP